MAIEQMPGGGTMITGSADIAFVRLLSMRSGLGLEIKTGMKMSSRYNVLSILQREGITTKRTKRAAYADLDARIVELGGESKPLAK